MTGSIAPNFHEGSRSEILADYLFSTWGSVTPVRRQDDYGIDLSCTLTKRKGQRAFVSEYYSVQVKSTTDAWIIDSDDSIDWLVNHPTPLYVAHVDKSKAQVSIYRTAVRFMVPFWPVMGKLELTFSDKNEGHCPQWTDPTKFDLSAPILRVTLADLIDAERMAELRKVFEHWVAVDREQCTLRRMSLLRLRESPKYKVNEIPDSGVAELGMIRPTKEQLQAAVETVVEALDCVGHQMLADGDRKFALYASLLLNHIRTTRAKQFKDNMRWGRPENPWGLESHIVQVLDPLLFAGRQATWALESLTEVIRQVEQTEVFSKLNEQAPATSPPSH